MNKIYIYSYFLEWKIEERSSFPFKIFHPPHTIFEEKKFRNEHLIQILDKNDENVTRGKTFRLKLEFYNTETKMKNVIRHIFA